MTMYRPPTMETPNVGSTADDLENEVRRAREERMKRRGQLAAGGLSSGQASPTRRSPLLDTQAAPSLSGDEALRKLLTERGITSPTVEKSFNTPPQSPLQSSQAMSAASSTEKSLKSNALLDRYGGALGPTGVARAGTNESPVSLASFMGGKAKGPKLGKLVGDGRSAPPEASLIEEYSSPRALPGLSKSSIPNNAGATPLANFLEARAVGKSSSYSPPKTSFSPPKTSFSPPIRSQSPPKAYRANNTAANPIRSTSPVRLNSAPISLPQNDESSLHVETSTSPIKIEDIENAKVITPSFDIQSQSKPNSGGLSPGSIIHSPTAEALSKFPSAQQSHRKQSTSPMQQQFSNVLPGLGQSGAAPTRNLYAANRKTTEEELAAINAQPVRLPGMGGVTSPFEKQKQLEAETSSGDVKLEPLAKGRAKPKKTSSATPSYATPNLALQTSNIASKQHSRSTPDSASRIADNTAALEALLDGRTVKTPPAHKVSQPPLEKEISRQGILKIAANQLGPTKVDQNAIFSSISRFDASKQKTISLEVFNIRSDGSRALLHGKEAATLYETESHVVIHQFKESQMSSTITTKVYAHVGKFSGILSGTGGAESGAIMDIAQQHRVAVIDARQGRESIDLVEALGGRILTLEGSRSTNELIGMFQVRTLVGNTFIDQVDMLTTNLSSAFSIIIRTRSSTTLWNGIGSTKANRKAAQEFVKEISKGTVINEIEEGKEGKGFWSHLDESCSYSNAWHHQFLTSLEEKELIPRLFTLNTTGSIAKIVEQVPFSALDVRRDVVSLLQLPLELYVLIGPEARSNRFAISTMIESAKLIAKKQNEQRGMEIMTLPIHVLIFPTLIPKEIRTAFRFWHDEHLNGKRWQRIELRMNIYEQREAQKQLQRTEFNFGEVEDDLFLPIGVGAEEVKGIDV